MDIGKKQRVIVVEPLGLSLEEELEELSRSTPRPPDRHRDRAAQPSPDVEPRRQST